MRAPQLTQDLPAGENPPQTGLDGTNSGPGEKYLIMLDNELVSALANIVTYWIGWWPVLHIVISKTFNPDVSFSPHGTVDLLDPGSLEGFSYAFYGAQSMTQSDVAELMAGGLGAATTQYLILYCVAIIGLHFVFLLSVINFLRSMTLTEIEVQQMFVGIVFNSILVSAAALHTLNGMKEGIRGMLEYFSSRYKASKPGQPGAIGRGNVIVLLMNFILIAMTICAFVGLTQGWW